MRDPSAGAVFHFLFAVGVFALSLSARLMSLTLQDRVIRLEMDVRLRRVLGDEAANRALGLLNLKQLIALRFAADDEIEGLIASITSGEVTHPNDIKGRIKDWQPDVQRV